MARIQIGNRLSVPSMRRAPLGQSGEIAGAITGSAMAQLGDTISDFANSLLVKKSKTYAAKASTQFKNEAIATFEQAKRLQDSSDIEGFTPEFIKVLDGVGQKYLEQAPTGLSRELLNQQFDIIKSSFMAKAIDFENATITAQSIANVEDVINESGNGLLVAPEEFQDSLATTLASIEAVSDMMTDEKTRALVERAQNTLALSAVRGTIVNNPAAAKEQLEKGRWDKFLTPDQKMALTKLASDGQKNSNAVLAFETERRIQSELAQIEARGTGTGLTRENVKNRYLAAGVPEDRAEVEARKFEIAKMTSEKLFNIGEQMSYASPEDRLAVVQNLKPEKGSRTFDIDQEVYKAAVKAYGDVQKALAEDPMAYVLNNDTVKEAFDPELGGSVEQGMKVALVTQARMLNPNYDQLREEGMTPNQIIKQTEGLRVLSKKTASDLINRLHTSDANEVFGILGEIRETYGSVLGDTFVYQSVMNELADSGLNGGMAFAISAAEFQAPGTVGLITAINTPMETIKKGLGEQNVPFTDIQAQVQSELQDFRNSFVAGDPTQIPFYLEIENALTKMAALRVASGLNEDEQDAVEYVQRNIIEPMFEVTGTALIPRVDVEGGLVDVEHVSQSMEVVLSSSQSPVLRKKLLSLGSFPAAGEFGKEKRFQQIGATGSFVNAPNGQGYHLQVIDSGVPIYLLDKSGNPVLFTNNDLLDLSMESEQARKARMEEALRKQKELIDLRASVGGITE